MPVTQKLCPGQSTAAEHTARKSQKQPMGALQIQKVQPPIPSSLIDMHISFKTA